MVNLSQDSASCAPPVSKFNIQSSTMWHFWEGLLKGKEVPSSSPHPLPFFTCCLGCGYERWSSSNHPGPGRGRHILMKEQQYKRSLGPDTGARYPPGAWASTSLHIREMNILHLWQTSTLICGRQTNDTLPPPNMSMS